MFGRQCRRIQDFTAFFSALPFGKDVVSQFLQELREAPKAEGQARIYTHGEKEMEAIVDRRTNGIPVNDNTMVEVLNLCNYLGMDFGKYFGDYRPAVSGAVFERNY